jgi:hypothetical protein
MFSRPSNRFCTWANDKPMGKSGYSKLHSIRGGQEERGRGLLRLDDPVGAASFSSCWQGERTSRRL